MRASLIDTRSAACVTALVAALGVLWLASLAHAQPGGESGREVPGSAPREAGFDVPWTTVEEAPCAMELGVSLAPLGANATSLAFVAVRAAVPVTALSVAAPASCDAGTVVWEVPRRLFDDVALRPLAGARAARLRTRIGAPLVACDTEYIVLSCVRDARGQLHAGTYAGGNAGRGVRTTRRSLDTLATPSGPVRAGSALRGHALVALDPATGQLVETAVRRWLEPKSSTRRRPFVQLQLDDGRLLAFLADERVWDAGARVFRRAADLIAGTTLRGPDESAPRVVSVTPGRTPAVSYTQFDVAWPDTLFVDGVLVHDAIARGSPAPRTPLPPYAPPPPGSVTVQPAVQSWDCQLTVDVASRTLPQGTESVAIVAAAHTGAPGTRRALGCAAPAQVQANLPRALLDAVRRDAGPDARLELTLSGGPVHCEALVDVLACLRDGSGALTATEPLARVGRAGPTCLAVGTLVETPSGAVAVESLAIGATVISRDPTSGRSTLAVVERVQPIEDRPVREVLLEGGGALRATPEHLVWSASRRAFVRVDSLRVGQLLLRRDGGTVRVREVADRGLRETVYDLSVTSPDTYFASGVLCHNY